MNDGDLSHLSPERRELLDLLLKSQSSTATREDAPPRPPASPPTSAAPSIHPATYESMRRPVSLVQQRMWVAERLAGAAPGSLHTLRCDVQGDLDLDALRRALAEIVRRHEVLRARFSEEDEGLFAIVDPEISPSLEEHDLRGLAKAEQEAAVERLISPDTADGLAVDLKSGPLHWGHLLRIADKSYSIVSVAHHIVFDGWSSSVFANELSQLYGAFSRGEPSPLTPLPIQYADFATWQRNWSQSSEAQAQLQYWRQTLSGGLPVTQLPPDRPPPPASSGMEAYAAKTLSFHLPASVCRRIEALNRERGTTTFMVLLASLLTLLYRCTGQEDMVIGSPAANRARAETEPLIGCLMHPMLLRFDLSGRPTFAELLERVREACLKAYRNQDVPFELVARSLKSDWEQAASLFHVLFNVQPRRNAALQLEGLEVTRYEQESPTTALDLSLHVWTGEQFECSIEYRTALFDAETIEWFGDRFLAVIESLLADPTPSLEALKIRPPQRLESGSAPSSPDAADAARPAMSAQRRELLQLMLRETSAVDACGAASSAAVDACGAASSAGEDRAEPLGVPARIPRVARGSLLPASFGQERLWFLEMVERQRGLFNQSQLLMLTGPLNQDALRQALNALIRRHEMLRTSFELVDGRPMQRIAERLEIELPVTDLSGLDSAARKSQFAEVTKRQSHFEFDVARPPLARISLVKLEQERHCLVATAHHLIGDGWSQRIFREDLADLYQAYCRDMSRGEELAPLDELPVQYADFAVWQRRSYRELVLQGQMAYWKRRLSGDLPTLELPVSEARCDISRNRHETVELGRTLSDAVRAVGREEGCTPFMTLLAAFKVLLHRYSGSTDLIVDTPVAGRSQQSLERLLGFFINSLALRTDLSGRPTFRELLERVRECCLGAFAHQDLPFDRVVAELQSGAFARGRPLAGASLMLHADVTEDLDFGGGVHMTPQEPDVSDEFDLTLIVWHGVNGFRCQFHYKEPSLAPELVRRMTKHWLRLVEGFVADPQSPIALLPMTTASERAAMVEDYNRTTAPREPDATIHGLIERQARRTPTATAVRFAGSEPEFGDLSFADLNQQANQWARRFQALGVRAGSRVGILLDRSPEMFIAILGVLKSGGAYAPLDIAYPPERLAWMMRDAELDLLVTQRHHAAQFDGLLQQLQTAVCHWDAVKSSVAEERDANLPPCCGGEHPAYMIYTSGSTGRPKGVLIPHRAAVNHHLSVKKAFALSEQDRVLQFHSLSFDAAVEETFPTWAAGGTVVMRGAELLTPADLDKLIASEALTVVNLPTSYWHEWVAEMSAAERAPHNTLRLTIVGGDKASPALLADWRRLAGARSRWLNTYGPTETAVISTLDEPSDDEIASGQLTIGHPISNTEVYVLDAELQLVPVGVPGEMYIGGAGVALGYHRRPGLTASRFVPDPFSRRRGDRLYRTGDRVRRAADGRIEFLGRVDHQIKIRGFRVEPGEIEDRLRRQCGVQQAVVVPHESQGREKQLAAYVVPELTGEPATPRDQWESEFVQRLRDGLRDSLPAYMTPAWIVVLDRIPLTSNGKVDRKALPAPQEQVASQRAFVPPQTDPQRRVAQIWGEVLGLDRVGLRDNFFDVGGHSLLLFQLQLRLQAEFGVEIPVVDLFRCATVQDQAERFEGTRPETSFEDVRDRAARQKNALRRQRRSAAVQRREQREQKHE